MNDASKTTEAPLDERIEKLSDAIGISVNILLRGASDIRQMQYKRPTGPVRIANHRHCC